MPGSNNRVQFANGYRLEASAAEEWQIMQATATDVSCVNNAGNPEGVVPANMGSICHDRTNGDLYVKNTGTGTTGWVLISTGGSAVTDSFAMQTGTSPVVPDGSGLVTFNGAVVAAGTNPVRTDGTGANTMALEVQISQAVAASDATTIGLSNFDSSAFSVDADGFTTWTLDWKDSVHAATTAALTATYANGSAGVGATLTNSGALAALSMDSVPITTLGQRVLVKTQGTPAENGIYTLTTAGSGAVAWVLTRATDYNRVFQIGPGNIVPVRNGTVNANTSWMEASVAPTTIGTDPISFGRFTAENGSLVQYRVLVADANSKATDIGSVGNSGEVLTSNGAGSNPSWQAVSSQSSIYWIQSQTASSSATLDFTTDTNSRTSYFFTFTGIRPATDNAFLWMQISNNGGSSWTSTGYQSGCFNGAYNGSIGATADNTTSAFILTGDIDNSSGNNTANGSFYCHNCNVGANAWVNGTCSFFTTSANIGFMGGSAGATGTNAFRFLMSTGNILAGTVSIYGVKVS